MCVCVLDPGVKNRDTERVSVCACVCVRERARERKSDRVSERVTECGLSG